MRAEEHSFVVVRHSIQYYPPTFVAGIVLTPKSGSFSENLFLRTYNPERVEIIKGASGTCLNIELCCAGPFALGKWDSDVLLRQTTPKLFRLLNYTSDSNQIWYEGFGQSWLITLCYTTGFAPFQMDRTIIETHIRQFLHKTSRQILHSRMH